jgi:hypothetical protein
MNPRSILLAALGAFLLAWRSILTNEEEDFE